MADAWWNMVSLAAVGVGTFLFLRQKTLPSRKPATPVDKLPVASSPAPASSSPAPPPPPLSRVLSLARLEVLHTHLKAATNEFEQREQLEELFTALDDDRDGCLTDSQANQFWQVAGLDHVATVVQHMGAGRLRMSQHPVLAELFALLDKDGDGELSPHEFAPLVAALEFPEHPPDAVQLIPEQLGPDEFAARMLSIVDRVPLSEMMPVVIEYLLAHDL
jgi:hypothetical protein